MKSLIVLFLMTVFSSCVFTSMETNKDGYMKFFHSYKNTEGIISFSLSPAFVGFFIEKDGNEDLDEVIDKLDKINFFIVENADKKLLKDMKSNIPKSKYKDIMVIKEGSASVIFKIRESKDKADELVMMVKDNSDMVVMCITGSFTQDDAKILVKSINVDDAIKLRK